MSEYSNLLTKELEALIFKVALFRIAISPLVGEISRETFDLARKSISIYNDGSLDKIASQALEDAARHEDYLAYLTLVHDPETNHKDIPDIGLAFQWVGVDEISTLSPSSQRGIISISSGLRTLNYLAARSRTLLDMSHTPGVNVDRILENVTKIYKSMAAQTDQLLHKLDGLVSGKVSE